MTGIPSGRPARIGLAVPEPVRGELFDPARFGRLAALGTLVEAGHPRDLVHGLPDVEVLITGWTPPPFTAELLTTAPQLRLIAHIGADVRSFATPDLHRRGVALTQAGQGMARSVGEVALTFTLSLLHQTSRFDRLVRDGSQWASPTVPPRHEILGCAVGVIGASRVGRSYIGMAQALGARLAVFDPYLSESGATELGVRKVSLPALLGSSRIVAIHAPSSPETRDMIGAGELALMPDGAGLVNTARSALVDQRALLAELRTGRLDAALDVFDEDPLPPDHPFRSLPNVMLTPYQAAANVDGRHRQADVILSEIGRFLSGQGLQYAVADPEGGAATAGTRQQTSSSNDHRDSK